jgi:type IV pilus assembly protein PilC
MPYFRWKGIDLQGTIRVGRSCAASLKDLDTQLLHDDIALLKSTQLSMRFFSRAVSMDVKIQFFSSFATLLEAGVMIPEALELVAQQVRHIGFHEVLYSLKRDVETGMLLSDGMAKHRKMFNPLMIEMVRIGYETGSLVSSLQRLVSYLETMQEFRKKIRMALTMPLITFLFFTIIASVLVVFVVPQFESLFASFKQPLPASTRIVLCVNRLIRSYGLYLIGFIVAAVGVCMVLYQRMIAVRYFFDRIALSVPFFGPLLVTRMCAQISQALALLLEGGIMVVDAFSIITSLVDNVILRDVLIRVKHDVQAGTQVSDALLRNGNGYLGSDAIALIRVGETSGTLAPMFAAAARRYQASVAYTLQWLLNLMQPLVIIFLGILITGLILAIYLPIMTISWGL